jgi:NAD(P)-dependent dehydrogenase (short-subunit alcohol dehydrogenase family)
MQRAYATSKLATVLFTQELTRRAHGAGVTAAAFHPGVIATDIGRDSAFIRLVMGSPLGRAFLSTPAQGAEPLLRLAVADPQAVNGTYFNRLKPENPASGQARDPGLARQLWDRSAELTGLQPLPSTAV